MSGQLYQDDMWRVVCEEATLPDGRKAEKKRVHRCDAVHILPFKDSETILLLKEYRPFWGKWCWMVPSGKMDKETDVTEAAQRELREETGFRANNLQSWFTTAGNETTVFTSHVFIGRDLAPDPLEQDAEELIEVHECSLREAIEKTLQRNNMHTVTGYILLRYAYENGMLKV